MLHSRHSSDICRIISDGSHIYSNYEQKVCEISFEPISERPTSKSFHGPCKDSCEKLKSNIFSGSGGCGKSTAMKHLSLSWADNIMENMTAIDFIFHVSLDMVQNDDDIENIIVQQHKGLKGNGVQPAKVKAILQNRTKMKVVIILDGHDECVPGTNSDIDHLLKREYLRNCGIVLSSRETDRLPEIREYMETEVEIKGFGKHGVEEYATRYLGSKKKCQELLQKTGKDKTRDYGILHIPIFLQMICVFIQ